MFGIGIAIGIAFEKIHFDRRIPSSIDSDSDSD